MCRIWARRNWWLGRRCGGRRWRRWCRATCAGPETGAAALHAAAEPRMAAFVDDLDDRQHGRPNGRIPFSSLSTPACKDIGFCLLIADRVLPAGVTLRALQPDRGLIALQGPKRRRRCWRRLCCRRLTRCAQIHGASATLPVERHRVRHQPVRLYRRGRGGDFRPGRPRLRPLRGGCWRCPACCRPGWARAIRCGWRPACASTATTSTRRRRRWRPTWSGRSASAADGMELSRRRHHPRPARPRRRAPARRHPARGAAAGARPHTHPRA